MKFSFGLDKTGKICFTVFASVAMACYAIIMTQVIKKELSLGSSF